MKSTLLLVVLFLPGLTFAEGSHANGAIKSSEAGLSCSQACSSVVEALNLKKAKAEAAIGEAMELIWQTNDRENFENLVADFRRLNRKHFELSLNVMEQYGERPGLLLALLALGRLPDSLDIKREMAEFGWDIDDETSMPQLVEEALLLSREVYQKRVEIEQSIKSWSTLLKRINQRAGTHSTQEKVELKIVDGRYGDDFSAIEATIELSQRSQQGEELSQRVVRAYAPATVVYDKDLMPLASNQKDDTRKGQNSLNSPVGGYVSGPEIQVRLGWGPTVRLKANEYAALANPKQCQSTVDFITAMGRLSRLSTSEKSALIKAITDYDRL